MKRRLLPVMLCALLLALGGCAHNLKDLPAATAKPTEVVTQAPEVDALDADTLALMQQTATDYAKEALAARMGDSVYTVDAVDTSARATFDGVFLVTLQYYTTAPAQYAYILRVDGDLQCEVLAEGVELSVEDMMRF